MTARQLRTMRTALKEIILGLVSVVFLLDDMIKEREDKQ